MRRGKLKAVIIGCGQIAGGYDNNAAPTSISTHIRAYQSRHDIDVVGVADSDESKAKAFSRRWHIPFYTSSARKLLSATRPDIVSICTPNEFHQSMLKLCTHFPVKGLWCEKPLAIETGAVRPLVVYFQRKGIPLLVNYMRRWLDQAQIFRTKLIKGQLGKVLRVSGSYVKGLRHNGSHTIDLWRYWFGEPHALAVWRRSPDHQATDGILDSTLRFGDIQATILGFGYPGFPFWEVDVLATRARVIFREGGNIVEWYEKLVQGPGGPELSAHKRTVRSNLNGVMKNVLEGLISSMYTKTPLLSDGENGLQTLSVCNRLLRLRVR